MFQGGPERKKECPGSGKESQQGSGRHKHRQQQEDRKLAHGKASQNKEFKRKAHHSKELRSRGPLKETEKELTQAGTESSIKMQHQVAKLHSHQSKNKPTQSIETEGTDTCTINKKNVNHAKENQSAEINVAQNMNSNPSSEDGKHVVGQIDGVSHSSGHIQVKQEECMSNRSALVSKASSDKEENIINSETTGSEDVRRTPTKSETFFKIKKVAVNDGVNFAHDSSMENDLATRITKHQATDIPGDLVSKEELQREDYLQRDFVCERHDGVMSRDLNQCKSPQENDNLSTSDLIPVNVQQGMPVHKETSVHKDTLPFSTGSNVQTSTKLEKLCAVSGSASHVKSTSMTSCKPHSQSPGSSKTQHGSTGATSSHRSHSSEGRSSTKHHSKHKSEHRDRSGQGSSSKGISSSSSSTKPRDDQKNAASFSKAKTLDKTSVTGVPSPATVGDQTLTQTGHLHTKDPGRHSSKEPGNHSSHHKEHKSSHHHRHKHKHKHHHSHDREKSHRSSSKSPAKVPEHGTGTSKPHIPVLKIKVQHISPTSGEKTVMSPENLKDPNVTFTIQKEETTTKSPSSTHSSSKVQRESSSTGDKMSSKGTSSGSSTSKHSATPVKTPHKDSKHPKSHLGALVKSSSSSSKKIQSQSSSTFSSSKHETRKDTSKFSSSTKHAENSGHGSDAAAVKKRKLSFDEQLMAVDKKADTPSKKLKTESPVAHSSSSKTSSQESSAKTESTKLKSGASALITQSKKHKLPSDTTASTPKKVKIECSEEDIEKFLYPKRNVPSSIRIGNIINSELDYRLRNHTLPTPGLKYGALIHIEKDSNGGGTVVHCYAEELAKLSASQMEEFVQDFFKIVFAEEPAGMGVHCMGIVHASATYLPDLMEHFAHHYPEMTIKRSVIGKSDIETSTMADYKENVRKTYSAGTFRHGGMLSVSTKSSCSFLNRLF